MSGRGTDLLRLGRHGVLKPLETELLKFAQFHKLTRNRCETIMRYVQNLQFCQLREFNRYSLYHVQRNVKLHQTLQALDLRVDHFQAVHLQRQTLKFTQMIDADRQRRQFIPIEFERLESLQISNVLADVCYSIIGRVQQAKLVEAGAE